MKFIVYRLATSRKRQILSFWGADTRVLCVGVTSIKHRGHTRGVDRRASRAHKRAPQKRDMRSLSDSQKLYVGMDRRADPHPAEPPFRAATSRFGTVDYATNAHTQHGSEPLAVYRWRRATCFAADNCELPDISLNYRIPTGFAIPRMMAYRDAYSRRRPANAPHCSHRKDLETVPY